MMPYKADAALRTMQSWTDSEFVRAAGGDDGERLKSALEGALDEAVELCRLYRQAIFDGIDNAGNDDELRMAIAIRDSAIGRPPL